MLCETRFIDGTKLRWSQKFTAPKYVTRLWVPVSMEIRFIRLFNRGLKIGSIIRFGVFLCYAISGYTGLTSSNIGASCEMNIKRRRRNALNIDGESIKMQFNETKCFFITFADPPSRICYYNLVLFVFQFNFF